MEYIKGKCNYIADFLSRINVQINTLEAMMEVLYMFRLYTLKRKIDLEYSIPIMDTVVNRFRTQIIVLDVK